MGLIVLILAWHLTKCFQVAGICGFDTTTQKPILRHQDGEQQQTIYLCT